MLMGPPFIQAVELGRDFLMRLCTRQSSRARGRERERDGRQSSSRRGRRGTRGPIPPLSTVPWLGGGPRQAAVVVWLNVLISKNQDNLPERNGAPARSVFSGGPFPVSCSTAAAGFRLPASSVIGWFCSKDGDVGSCSGDKEPSNWLILFIKESVPAWVWRGGTLCLCVCLCVCVLCFFNLWQLFNIDAFIFRCASKRWFFFFF